MSISAREKAVNARHKNGQIVVQLSSGRSIAFAVGANPRLARGTPAQLNNIEISPFGLHWPDLDEDLSTAGIIAGRLGLAAGTNQTAARKKLRVRMQLLVSPECRDKALRLARKKKVGLSKAVEELIAGA